MNKLKEEIKDLIDKENDSENLKRIKSMLETNKDFNELLLKVLEKSDKQTEGLIPHTSVRDFRKTK